MKKFTEFEHITPENFLLETGMAAFNQPDEYAKWIQTQAALETLKTLRRIEHLLEKAIP